MREDFGDPAAPSRARASRGARKRSPSIRTSPAIAEIIAASIGPLIDEAEYWRRRATDGDVLKPLGKPCHDCAVVWGLYSPMTDELAKQPAEIQEAVSVRWFCHNHPDRACRGNIDRLTVAQGTEARRGETAQAGSIEDDGPVAEGDAP